jgi:type I restriction enzyme R subunit
MVFDQWDKLDSAGVFSDVDVEAAAKAYFGGGASTPSQGKLSAALSPVRERFNAAYAAAVAEDDTSGIDRLDTFRRDLRTFVNTYDFLAAIVDYDDVDLEKRALFARMLAQVLKDSQRHEPTIDLSGVALTHHVLHKQPGSDLDLSKGEAAGLSALIAAGSRGRHETDLVPWSAVMEQINALFEGDGLTDGDQISAVESVLRKMLESEDLRAQARANNKQDFFAGPDLWGAMQEIIVEAGDQHAKGLERLATDRSKDDILAILAMMRLWEALREDVA